jgi:hypothetical protein
MNGLEEQADNAKARDLYWKPRSWLGTIRPTSTNDAFDPALWTTLGLEVPVLSSLPRLNNSPLAKCGCKKHCSVLWTFTATTQPPVHLTQVQPRRTTGWYLSLALCFARLDTRSAHNKGSRLAQANGAATWRSATTYETKWAAGAWSSTLSITHRSGSSSNPWQNGRLTTQTTSTRLFILLRETAQRKINSCWQQCMYCRSVVVFSLLVGAGRRGAGRSGAGRSGDRRFSRNNRSSTPARFY